MSGSSPRRRITVIRLILDFLDVFPLSRRVRSDIATVSRPTGELRENPKYVLLTGILNRQLNARVQQSTGHPQTTRISINLARPISVRDHSAVWFDRSHRRGTIAYSTVRRARRMCTIIIE